MATNFFLVVFTLSRNEVLDKYPSLKNTFNQALSHNAHSSFSAHCYTFFSRLSCSAYDTYVRRRINELYRAETIFFFKDVQSTLSMAIEIGWCEVFDCTSPHSAGSRKSAHDHVDTIIHATITKVSGYRFRGGKQSHTRLNPTTSFMTAVYALMAYFDMIYISQTDVTWDVGIMWHLCDVSSLMRIYAQAISCVIYWMTSLHSVSQVDLGK